jgi:hypothetical protein
MASIKDSVHQPGNPVPQTINSPPAAKSPVTVIPPMPPFTVRETQTEGDTDGADGFQTARSPGPFKR